MFRILLLALLVSLPIPVHAAPEAGSLTSELPAYQPQDAQAPVVTERNLLASERFWPYQVALRSAWRPPGRAEALPRDAAGVLIRVEDSGAARIDFGRDGLYEVPVATTDLVSGANRIRLGELEKLAPNFVLAIGPRLIDSGAETLRPLPLRAVSAERGFLCVFADPESDDFPALAAALAPLRKHPGIAAVLFPQGAHPDARVHERLRALHWTVAFVYDHLSEAYTRTLWADPPPPQGVLLLSNEGRVLFQGAWRPETVPQLSAAFARAFGAANSSRSPQNDVSVKLGPERSQSLF